RTAQAGRAPAGSPGRRRRGSSAARHSATRTARGTRTIAARTQRTICSKTTMRGSPGTHLPCRLRPGGPCRQAAYGSGILPDVAQGTRSGPAPQQAHVPRGATKVPAAQAQALLPVSGGAATVPAALVNAPRQLSLEAYELTPATFDPWRDYVTGDPKDQLWQR